MTNSQMWQSGSTLLVEMRASMTCPLMARTTDIWPWLLDLTSFRWLDLAKSSFLGS
jgi:hypothetical protein